ncbi:upstream stimulatory factor 1-like [Chanos chanos]|uniref:Upstream stimulatory factor 1 n=1 Tax=Chanos chanos TaxID=29144 RepID=A0A6J2WWY3_CHACN|nr:upstream stimulatory factor 1-like [Chanos chanos]
MAHVTYQVIHVAEGQMEGQVDEATTEVFCQTKALEEEGQYCYPDTTMDTMVTAIQAPDSLLTQSAPTGQLYVMMSPQDILSATSQKSVSLSKENNNIRIRFCTKTETKRGSHNERRRTQHNEVERRRRDKINNWILQLSKLIPDCGENSAKNGQSKGLILSKACDYIQVMRQSNARLEEELETLERLRMDNQLLRQEAEEWKSKNQMLRNKLQHHGITSAANVNQQ